jgi:hypothetical protein
MAESMAIDGSLIGGSLREQLERAQQTRTLRGTNGIFATFFFIANSPHRDALYCITSDGHISNNVHRYHVYNNNTNKLVATLLVDAETCDLVCVTDNENKYITNLLTASYDDLTTLCETIASMI